MSLPFLINNELKIIDVTRDKVVWDFVFDIDQIPEDELVWMIKQYKYARKLIRMGKKPVDIARELFRESEKILRKGYRGDNGRIMNPFLLDPPMRALHEMIVDYRGSQDIGMWWCDGGDRGKYFTETLAQTPDFDYEAHGRRAVALNPWSLSNPSDLDTVIDSKGYHKEGIIGKLPFSISKAPKGTESGITASFVGASNVTVYSVIVLIPSDDTPQCYSDPYTRTPSTKDLCASGRYCTIYMPIWGWDTETQITENDAYLISMRFWTTI